MCEARVFSSQLLNANGQLGAAVDFVLWRPWSLRRPENVENRVFDFGAEVSTGLRRGSASAGG